MINPKNTRNSIVNCSCFVYKYATWTTKQKKYIIEHFESILSQTRETQKSEWETRKVSKAGKKFTFFKGSESSLSRHQKKKKKSRCARRKIFSLLKYFFIIALVTPETNDFPSLFYMIFQFFTFCAWSFFNLFFTFRIALLGLDSRPWSKSNLWMHTRNTCNHSRKKWNKTLAVERKVLKLSNLRTSNTFYCAD